MPIRPRFAVALVALACAALTGCSSLKVNATWDSTVDFSKYHTFAFRADRQLDDPSNEANAERTIAAALTAKGFRLDPQNPDFLIGLYPFLSADIKGDTAPAGTIQWDAWGPPIGADISTGGHDTTPGSVTMTFRDTRTGQPIWRGMGTGNANLDDRKRTTQKVMDALRSMLEKFPPKKT